MSEYIEFQFNGYNSKDLGLIRVSSGNRYSDSFTPDFQDKKADLVGGHGSLYWETYYSTKTIKLDYSFDSLGEGDIRKLRQVFNGQAVGPLIFSETPYKAYLCKVKSTPSFSFMVFEEEGQRVYKGDGSIDFIAYEPFARSVHKFLNEYPLDAWGINKYEWNKSATLKSSPTDNNKGTTYDLANKVTLLYNAGDLETDFRLVFKWSDYNVDSNPLTLTSVQDGKTLGILTISPMIKKGSDWGFFIDTSTNLIQGIDSNGNQTGNLYNEYIKEGNFFKIPLEESTLECTKKPIEVIYDYLYY